MILQEGTTHWEIKTHRLSLRIAKPGVIYKRTRFDWTGHITDVVLDNKHSFCSVESPNPLEGAGGIGFCNEYGIHEPVGYDEIGIGGKFLKFGIGELQKISDEPYFFMKDYPLVPFAVRTIITNTGLCWETSTNLCNGYAAFICKTLEIHDNMMIIHYIFKNIGDKVIKTTEYNHNFVIIDNLPMDSDYHITFSQPITLLKNDGSVWFDKGSYQWENDVQSFYGSCTDVPATGSLSWEIWNDTVKCGLREELNTPALRVGLWGMSYVVSPELFKKIDLLPGETDTWTRTYTFLR